MPVLAQPSEDRLEGTGLAGSGPQGEVGVSYYLLLTKVEGQRPPACAKVCQG